MKRVIGHSILRILGRRRVAKLLGFGEKNQHVRLVLPSSGLRDVQSNHFGEALEFPLAENYGMSNRKRSRSIRGLSTS